MLPNLPITPIAPSNLKKPLLAAFLVHACIALGLGWSMGWESTTSPVHLVHIELTDVLIGVAPIKSEESAQPEGPQVNAQPKTNTDAARLRHDSGQLHQKTSSEAIAPPTAGTPASATTVAASSGTAAASSGTAATLPKPPSHTPSAHSAKPTSPATPRVTSTNASRSASYSGISDNRGNRKNRDNLNTPDNPDDPDNPASSNNSVNSAHSNNADNVGNPDKSGANTLTTKRFNTDISGTGPTQKSVSQVGNPKAEKAYLAHIVKKLHRSLRYPASARSKRISGTTTITFTLNATGKVMQAQIHKGSGFDELDAEALALVQRVSPFKSIPENLGHKTMTLTVPIRFSLR